MHISPRLPASRNNLSVYRCRRIATLSSNLLNIRLRRIHLRLRKPNLLVLQIHHSIGCREKRGSIRQQIIFVRGRIYRNDAQGVPIVVFRLRSILVRGGREHHRNRDLDRGIHEPEGHAKSLVRCITCDLHRAVRAWIRVERGPDRVHGGERDVDWRVSGI